LFNLIGKYFWAVALAFGAINAISLRFKFSRIVREQPEHARGYAQLFWGYSVAVNVPWVVMGVGSTVGEVPTVWHYFRPQDGNPWVLAFWGGLLLLWLLGTYWLFLARGAEMLAQHPGFLLGLPSNPSAVKEFWLLCLAGAGGGLLMIFLFDFPMPLAR